MVICKSWRWDTISLAIYYVCYNSLLLNMYLKVVELAYVIFDYFQNMAMELNNIKNCERLLQDDQCNDRHNIPYGLSDPERLRAVKYNRLVMGQLDCYLQDLKLQQCCKIRYLDRSIRQTMGHVHSLEQQKLDRLKQFGRTYRKRPVGRLYGDFKPGRDNYLSKQKRDGDCQVLKSRQCSYNYISKCQNDFFLKEHPGIQSCTIPSTIKYISEGKEIEPVSKTLNQKCSLSYNTSRDFQNKSAETKNVEKDLRKINTSKLETSKGTVFMCPNITKCYPPYSKQQKDILFESMYVKGYQKRVNCLRGVNRSKHHSIDETIRLRNENEVAWSSDCTISLIYRKPKRPVERLSCHYCLFHDTQK